MKISYMITAMCLGGTTTILAINHKVVAYGDWAFMAALWAIALVSLIFDAVESRGHTVVEEAVQVATNPPALETALGRDRAIGVMEVTKGPTGPRPKDRLYVVNLTGGSAVRLMACGIHYEGQHYMLIDRFYTNVGMFPAEMIMSIHLADAKEEGTQPITRRVRAGSLVGNQAVGEDRSQSASDGERPSPANVHFPRRGRGVNAVQAQDPATVSRGLVYSGDIGQNVAQQEVGEEGNR